MTERETYCFSARFWVNLAMYYHMLRKCWTPQILSYPC